MILRDDNQERFGSRTLQGSPLALSTDRSAADTPDASIVHGKQTITIVVARDNVIKRKTAGKVRVEGSDRTGPLELSTDRPAANTPDTSIAHGGKTIIIEVARHKVWGCCPSWRP